MVTLTATRDSLHGPLHPRVCVVLVGTDASRPTDGKAEPAAHHLQRGAEHLIVRALCATILRFQ